MGGSMIIMNGSSKSTPGLTANEPTQRTRSHVTTPTAPNQQVVTESASFPPFHEVASTADLTWFCGGFCRHV